MCLGCLEISWLALKIRSFIPPQASTADDAMTIDKISKRIFAGGALGTRSNPRYKTPRPRDEKRPRLTPPLLVPARIQIIIIRA